jgi:hypothetical protein
MEPKGRSVRRTYSKTVLYMLLLVAQYSSAQVIASKQVWVDHGDYADVNNPPCKTYPENALADILDGLMHGKITIPSVDKFVGTIVDLLPGQLGDALAQTNGEIGKFFHPNRYSNCGSVIMKLPPNAANVSVRVFAEGRECVQGDGPYRYCPVGWSAWGIWQNGDYIGATFKNWSHNLARTATIEIDGTVPPPWPKVHVVAAGDNLSKISQATYENQYWPKIYRANKLIISDPDLIYPGQKLTLPAP